MAILPFLLAAAVTAAPFPSHTQPRLPVREAAARPALWVVNDDDTVIYLFGTFHALDGKTRWFDSPVRTAFSASQSLMLETLVPRPVAVTGSGNLAPFGRGRAAPPVAELAPSSFLGTTKMVVSAGRSKGLSTDHGADAVLRDAADQLGKPVAGLESFEAQLKMFSSLPAPQSAPPANDPRVTAALASVLSDLQTAWSRGDIDAFAPMLRQMQAQSPQTYNRMFVERNERWAQWIAERMKAPGTIMVAVGAGHLSGPDSVQNKLADLGVRSARVN